MRKQYFECMRIGLCERTNKQVTFKMLLPWDSVDRIEEEVGEPFDYAGPLTIIITTGGDTLWVRDDYERVANHYKQYLAGCFLPNLSSN